MRCPSSWMVGTTSAHAENTKITVTYYLPKRNYLRVRGEYSNAESKGTTSAELPPRARRILGRTESKIRLIGTTSACAENTQSQLPLRPSPGNYLRVRGEYPRPGAGRFFYPELPPRARRIRLASIPPRCGGGTTSACAENTVRKNTCD